MKLEALAGRYAGQDVMIVGTGPSLRLFPRKLLVRWAADYVVIGLNKAWQLLPAQFSITAHPELVAEYEARDVLNTNTTQWIAKQKGILANRSLDDPNYRLFKTSDDWKIVGKGRPEATLFLGRGIQLTAMHLAQVMGARTIYLVGVDMAGLGGDHHAHEQHVRFHGLAPADVYAEYQEWTQKMRDILWSRFQIPVVSLTPFVGLNADKDYKHQCESLKLPTLPPPEDTSGYLRKGTDKP